MLVFGSQESARVSEISAKLDTVQDATLTIFDALETVRSSLTSAWRAIQDLARQIQ
jgi:hypothetical protein